MKDFDWLPKDLQDFGHYLSSYGEVDENKSITLNSLNDDQKTTLMSLSGVKDFPMRVKCATMAWHTLSSVLEK